MEKESNLSRTRTRTNNKRRRLKKSLRQLYLVGGLIMLLLLGVYMYKNEEMKIVSTEPVNKTEETQTNELKEEATIKETINETTIKLSAAGDFTLGTDDKFSYLDSFVSEASANGLPYFVEGLDDVFLEDDLTTVNLETTLTDATEKATKTFTFKGDPSYAQILELGGIDAVNLANNHTFDYLQKGYEDTIAALKSQEIGYFGYDHQLIRTIKGIKIGALGYEGWADTPEIRKQIVDDIKSLQNKDVEIILVHFHWGTEKQYVPNDVQKSLARYTIDQGADLILGHHPHVIQGIEEYKGKFIVYSLGNFMFGGNRNPSDKDTFVFQQTFHLKNGVLADKKEISILPFSISSVSSRNNYQPTLLTGVESDRVKQKIIDVSNQINGSEWLVYERDEQ